jgi:hypothetical protein
MIKQGRGGRIIGASSLAGKQGKYLIYLTASFAKDKLLFQAPVWLALIALLSLLYED